MSIKLTFEIVFHSDYHVTDGQRFGLAVDSALLRDHNQSPVLRGTALAGLLRDGFKDLQALVARSGITNKPDLSFPPPRRCRGKPAVGVASMYPGYVSPPAPAAPNRRSCFYRRRETAVYASPSLSLAKKKQAKAVPMPPYSSQPPAWCAI